MLFLLAFAAQVASLSIIVAPPYAVIQHYLPWSSLPTQAPRLAITILVTQAAVILWLSLRQWRELSAGIRRIGPPSTLAFTLAVLGFSAAVPTGTVTRFIGEIALSFGLMMVAILNLMLAAQSLPERWLLRIRAGAESRLRLTNSDITIKPWDRKLPWLAAAWVFTVSAGISFFVFERVPHVDDSIAYLFQAKYFSMGVLSLPRPVDPDSFAVAHLIVDGDKWYSKFFPGWPAVLALGVLFGAPWLVNPLLGAATIVLLHSLIRRLYGVATAHGVTLLACASPWLIFLSASFMSHTASLFWMLLALTVIAHMRRNPAIVWGAVAGSSLGMMFLTRPFDAVLAGPVVVLWALRHHSRRPTTAGLAAAAISAAVVAGLYFPYNAALTGDPAVAPHRLWAEHIFGPGVDVFGFGPSVGIPLWRNIDPLPGHGLADVVLNANKNFALLNFESFGWATGSLGLACLALKIRWSRRNDMMMYGLLLTVISGHVFYWAPGGPDFGARYWYLLILPLLVLTIKGAERLSTVAVGESGRHALGATRVGLAISFASLSAVLVILPWRSIGKYHEYRSIGAGFRKLARTHDIQDGLVFVRTSDRSEYQAAFNLNHPSAEESENVYAWDRGEDNRSRVLSEFPAKPVWLVERNAATAELVITRGPLPPGTDPGGNPPEAEVSLQAVVR